MGGVPTTMGVEVYLLGLPLALLAYTSAVGGSSDNEGGAGGASSKPRLMGA
jgi:hypothetical protein